MLSFIEILVSNTIKMILLKKPGVYRAKNSQRSENKRLNFRIVIFVVCKMIIPFAQKFQLFHRKYIRFLLFGTQIT